MDFNGNNEMAVSSYGELTHLMHTHCRRRSVSVGSLAEIWRLKAVAFIVVRHRPARGPGPKEGAVVLAFRGTISLADCVTDMAARAVLSPELGCAQRPARGGGSDTPQDWGVGGGG